MYTNIKEINYANQKTEYANQKTKYNNKIPNTKKTSITTKYQVLQPKYQVLQPKHQVTFQQTFFQNNPVPVDTILFPTVSDISTRCTLFISEIYYSPTNIE